MNFIEQKNYDINSADSKNFCIEENSCEFLSKYYILINHYIGFYIENIYDNSTINTDKRYRYYILTRGLELLKTVMEIILIYTNNIDFAFYYSNKAYYYYIEFISQLDTDNNHLELNIKDAIIFVYKKTIFDIKEPFSNLNNSNVNEANRLKIENITTTIRVINSYVEIFKIKGIINREISNNECIENQNNYDKQFLRMITRIEKNYNDDVNYKQLIINIDGLLTTILHIVNRYNIITDSQDPYSFDAKIDLEQISILIDKVVNKLFSYNPKQSIETIDFTSIIIYNDLENLNNLTIRQKLSQLDNRLMSTSISTST